jgi:hypothetical protein
MSESIRGASPSCLYFYTDPLAAAWMAKHFGMKIYAWALDALDDVNAIAREQPPFVPDCKYMIDDPSLPLLEPRPGDLVTYKLGVVGCVGMPYTNGPLGVWWAGSERQEPLHGKERVIQRDGKPFFWPEQDMV